MAKEAEEKKYKVEHVATQTAPVITDGKEQMSGEEAIVLILNKLEKIEKNIVG